MLLHAFCSAERQSDQTVQSSATWRTTFGRCTFTATRSPLHSVAWYTCPSDAAATGARRISANRGASFGSRARLRRRVLRRERPGMPQILRDDAVRDIVVERLVILLRG